MVVKTSTTNYADDGYAKAGDTIDYNYAVTNTGPDTLTGITVNDNLVPSADITCPELVTGRRGVRDVHGHLHGDPDRRGHRLGDQHGHQQRHQTRPMRPSPRHPRRSRSNASDATSSLSLVKTASTTYADNGYGAAGDVISYSYAVTNTGTDTLSGIAINDSLVPSADIICPDLDARPWSVGDLHRQLHRDFSPTWTPGR